MALQEVLHTSEFEVRWEDDVYSCALYVEHDAEVNGYTAQNGKAVHKRPVRGVQRDLVGNNKNRKQHRIMNKWQQTNTQPPWFKKQTNSDCPSLVRFTIRNVSFQDQIPAGWRSWWARMTWPRPRTGNRMAPLRPDPSSAGKHRTGWRRWWGTWRGRETGWWRSSCN